MIEYYYYNDLGVLHMSRLYSEEVINKLLNECVSTWEVKDKLEKLSDDECATLDTFELSEGDTIAIMFPDKDGYAEGVSSVIQYLDAIYPDVPKIGILSDMDVLIQQADQAIDMLDKMKAKISIVKDTPAEKKIII